MKFHVEERLAWIRTNPHTVVRDLDPDFPRFREDTTGSLMRILRIGTPFINLTHNSTLKGITIYYPEQVPQDIHPYPWTIQGRGQPGIHTDTISKHHLFPHHQHH